MCMSFHPCVGDACLSARPTNVTVCHTPVNCLLHGCHHARRYCRLFATRPSPVRCTPVAPPVSCRMGCPGVHFFGASTFYMHDGARAAWSPLAHSANLAIHSTGYPGAGVLAPPPPTSPTSSPTRPVQGSHSAQASPTNTLKTVRPRARSADESVSGKKVSAWVWVGVLCVGVGVLVWVCVGVWVFVLFFAYLNFGD